MLQAMVQELGKLLDPGVPPYQPKKKESSVFMFVGLQVLFCGVVISYVVSYLPLNFADLANFKNILYLFSRL